MAEETLASVIALHQPKRTRTRAVRPRTDSTRKRQKPKADESQSSESLIPAEFLPREPALAESAPALPESSPAPPSSAPTPATSNVAPARWSVASLVLAAAAFTLAAVGVTTHGWFARSLGSSD